MGERVMEWMMEHETLTVVVLSTITSLATTLVLMAIRSL